MWRHFFFCPLAFQRVPQTFEVFFLPLLSFSRLLITHSLFGDRVIEIYFVRPVWIVVYLDRSQTLCTPQLLCVYTLLQLCRNFHRSQASRSWQTDWNQQRKIQNIFKILFVYKPAFSFLKWVGIGRKVKVMLAVHNNSFMTSSVLHFFQQRERRLWSSASTWAETDKTSEQEECRFVW